VHQPDSYVLLVGDEVAGQVAVLRPKLLAVPGVLGVIQALEEAVANLPGQRDVAKVGLALVPQGALR
jgi:ABC-type branched-subunit amino acid transport system ATPase component